jgi:hypothetical protein
LPARSSTVILQGRNIPTRGSTASASNRKLKLQKCRMTCFGFSSP